MYAFVAHILQHMSVCHHQCDLTEWYGVCRARERESRKIFALKKIKMERETEGFPLTSIREINILLALHHKNIVNVTEVHPSAITALILSMSLQRVLNSAGGHGCWDFI